MKSDTAWSQLIEAQANREGKAGIIVFDSSLVDGSVLSTVQDVKYIPAIGFVTIIDSQKGDYRNLGIAYMLARDIVVNARDFDLDRDLLSLLVNRIIKDISDFLSIRSLVLSNIDTCKKILTQMEKSMLSMEFTQKYMVKFLRDGQLTREDLLEFYSGDDIRDKFRIIEKDIKNI